MRTPRSLVVAALIGAGLGTMQLATAQQQAPGRAEPAPSTSPRPDAAVSPMQRDRAPVTRDADWDRTHRATKIVGTDVYNRQAEKLGKIDDIVIEPRSGQVRYAVVAIGGFLGVGDKLIAVPWRALEIDRAANRYIMDGTRERLQDAPSFQAKEWPNMDDPKWTQENQKFYVERARAGPEPATETGGGARRDAGKS